MRHADVGSPAVSIQGAVGFWGMGLSALRNEDRSIGWERDITFWAGVDPLRYAARAARKPRVAVSGTRVTHALRPWGLRGTHPCVSRPIT
jgi:hypothetical protein